MNIATYTGVNKATYTRTAIYTGANSDTYTGDNKAT